VITPFLPAQPSFLEPRTGVKGWFAPTDPKRVALLYLAAMLSWFAVAAGLGLAHLAGIRQPVPAQHVKTLSSLPWTLILPFLLPGMPAVFGNFLLPLLIGARGVALPRLNLASWYSYLAGSVLALAALGAGGGVPGPGWAGFGPLGLSATLARLGILALGCSTLLTGINVLCTIHRLRAPGMTFLRMPLFVWGLYATAWVQILATPMVALSVALVFLDRLWGGGLLDPALGGGPLRFQHLFRLHAQTAVYLLILPAMGAVTEILPTFTQRAVAGYRAIALSMLAIAGLGSLVWAHPLFTSGLADLAHALLPLVPMLAAIPGAVLVFSWLATLGRGSLRMAPPVPFALSFILLLCMGGLSGAAQGALGALGRPGSLPSWVAASCRFGCGGAALCGFLAALLYWFPKMFGRLYRHAGVYAAWVPIMAGLLLLCGARWVGLGLLALGLLMLAGTLAGALFRGRRAGHNPWGGVTMEWTVPSPPPAANFRALPTVTTGPYPFPEEGVS